MQHTIEGDNFRYRYDIIDMRDISCMSLLESNDPSAIVLSILCDFEDMNKQEVVNTILIKLRKLCDDREYANHLRMVSVLSTNRKLEKEFEKGVEMLTVEIEKTPLYMIGEKRGEKRGEKMAALKYAMTVMQRYKIPIDDIVKDFNIKKEELLAYMNKRVCEEN